MKSLLFHEAGDVLIVMTEAYILGQFHVDQNGGLNEVNKVSCEPLRQHMIINMTISPWNRSSYLEIAKICELNLLCIYR